MSERKDTKSNSQEHQIKHDRVLEYLESHELDAVLLSRRCNFSWYTCGARNYVVTAGDVGNSYLLIEPARVRVLTSNIEATRLRAEEFDGTDIEVLEFSYADPAGEVSALTGIIGSMKVASDVPVMGVDVAALSGDFDRLRWSLTPWEIQRYRCLCTDTVACVEHIAQSAKPGQSEYELAGLLAGELYERGCVPWVLLVAGDERIARHRHPLPTDKKVQTLSMLVTCAEREGLIAACTRLVSFAPLNKELIAKHAATATVDAAMITSTQVGTTLGGVFKEGMQAYAAAGYGDQWRLHHQGGSCGYLPREIVANPSCDVPVLANQAFAWNPSITGTKSEDTIISLDSGPQLLAGETDWPTIEAEWNGQTLKRPDILISKA